MGLSFSRRWKNKRSGLVVRLSHDAYPDTTATDLLAHACESLASANVMALDLVDQLEGTSRNILLGIAQVIMLGELAVNRALDQLEPT